MFGIGKKKKNVRAAVKQVDEQKESVSIMIKQSDDRRAYTGTGIEQLDNHKIECNKIIQENIVEGETITFGKYTDTNCDVEWRVLRVWKQERKALVLSEKSFGNKQYHDKNMPITWEDCSVRKWLNGEFADDVLQLTDEEKARIMTVNLQNEDNLEYGTPGGNSTWDRFFLLSLREVELYLKEKRDRVCYDNDGQETVWWWLRSPGYYINSAAFVYDYGNVFQYGFNVLDESVGVRPAFFLNLKS